MELSTQQIEVGDIVLSKLPTDLDIWKADKKSRPMLVWDVCISGLILIPLTTTPYVNEKILMPNEINHLAKPSAVFTAHRLFYTLDRRLEVIGTLDPQEMRTVSRVIEEADKPVFHLSM